MPPTFDATLLTGWVRAATQALERHRAEIDRINVFPVPDRDTGTNLLLTMRAAGETVRRAGREGGPGDAAAVAAALARGALLGARGNSGVILSQVLRGVAEAVAAVAVAAVAVGAARREPGSSGGAVLADALVRAARLATAAVSRPREGTVLSVLAAAAAAAAATGSDRLDEVALAAADAAAGAVRATTGQLPELTRAGVVDAGGLGLYLVLDALAGLASGRAATADLPRPDDAGMVVEAVADADLGAGPGYEVMYLLDGADDAGVDRLRARLDLLGDSVAVVGDGAGTWNVHVHCSDVGAAIEAGIAVGRPHRIAVTRFAEQVAEVGGPPGGAVSGGAVSDRAMSDVAGGALFDGARSDAALSGGARPLGVPGRFVRPRAVLMVVTGAEIAVLARSAGAAVLQRPAGGSVGEPELVAALAATCARHVVLLPDDSDLTTAAESAASLARRAGQEVLVVPTASVLQGLAALAVHDPQRRPGEDVVAMAEAAALTRTAGLMVAESEALTWVGRCEPGDVLGIADGEVVVIAPDLSVGALWLAHRMLLTGGEIVTVLLGRGVEEALGEGLAADLRRTHPEVDVVVHRGGQTDFPLVLGVE